MKRNVSRLSVCNVVTCGLGHGETNRRNSAASCCDVNVPEVQQFALNRLVQRERFDLYSGVASFESVIIMRMVFLRRTRKIQGKYLKLGHHFIIHFSLLHFTSLQILTDSLNTVRLG